MELTGRKSINIYKIKDGKFRVNDIEELVTGYFLEFGNLKGVKIFVHPSDFSGLLGTLDKCRTSVTPSKTREFAFDTKYLTETGYEVLLCPSRDYEQGTFAIIWE